MSPRTDSPTPRSRPSPTRSTSATRRAAPTATTSRSMPNPGEQLTIHLSHLKVDDDLVIYGPGIAPLRTPHPGAEAPSAGDVPFDLGQRTQSITPEALTDVPQDAVDGQAALDVSDNRGLADEEVSAVSPEGRDVHDPGRELRRWLQQRAVDAADREIALDRRCRPRAPTRRAPARASPTDAGRADDREHPLSLRLEALRRPVRAPGRERRLQPAADACGANGRGRRRGDPGRRQRRRPEPPSMRAPRTTARPRRPTTSFGPSATCSTTR